MDQLTDITRRTFKSQKGTQILLYFVLGNFLLYIPQQIYNDMTAHKKTQYVLPPLREKIDHYSYVGKESIGKGFSSSVFKGRDDITDEQVAIKIIDLKAMKGEIHKNLLAGQIEILSMIKNRPNLLDVHKICTDQNKTYIITDFCEGGDLGKLIKSKKKLNETEAIKIIREIIRGYQSLYSLGIVHRDLKPANIFFRNSHLEIGDFGFAVKQQNLKLTERYNVGSPVYMPPQALNSNKYSYKSDIWAIGIIFYEMLTGTTPWTGRTETELKAKMKTIAIRNILPPSITKASSKFLKRSLQTDPKKRMQAYQMFQHFDLNHENDEDEKDSYLNEQNRLFRSMRKSTRNQLMQTRGESMKKTANVLLKKTNSNNNPQLLQTTAYGMPAPKTALQIKQDKEYMSAIQKRMISKQLLSQVHFCRFLYKLIANIEAGISYEVDNELQNKLISLLFYKLKQTKQLKLVQPQIVEQYRQFGDYKKLEKLIDEYFVKYRKRLGRQSQNNVLSHHFSPQMYKLLIHQITQQIKQLFQFVNKSHEPCYLIKQIIVLDYLITMAQLIQLLKNGNIQQFHVKSKIQAIVDGEAISQVSAEHVRMIGNKLKALRII